ncbi:MAG: hypothetical protein EBY29_10110 [Planctomycetes bacterium]|nr:hypothetical protein [Planctomycetota bacterium]
MNTEQLSNTEILEAAKALRERTSEILQYVFSSDESALLQREKEILETRRRGGFGGIVDSLVGTFAGKRATAERMLIEARQAEAEIERLLTEKGALEAGMAKQQAVLQRLQDIASGYHAKVTPEAEKAHFLSRFWASDDFRLPGHLNQVAVEISTARILAEYIDLYIDMQRSVVEGAEKRVTEISKQISKIK